jgi:hypothetical protein
MQIVDISFFSDLNYYSFECKRSNGSVTPNNTKELSDLCVKLEREILLNTWFKSLQRSKSINGSYN